MRIPQIITKLFSAPKPSLAKIAPDNIPPKKMAICFEMIPDAFIKTEKQAEEFIPFRKMLPRQITKEWFENLSKENRAKYDVNFQSHSFGINYGEIKLFKLYAKYLKEGLEKISGEKPYKFISIGQSPAIFAKILGINGVDIGICPISELSKLKSPCYNIAKITENSDKYFKYLKNYNVDLENIDPNKNYFFSDYTVSGESLKSFKNLLTQKGIKGENIHCIPLDNILKHAQISAEHLKSIQDVNNYYLYMQNAKNRYSPIFKLPIDKLNLIEEIEKINLGSEANTRCNTALYWLLKNQNS